MLEFNEFTIPEKTSAVVVSIIHSALEGHENPESAQASLRELHELLRTLDISVYKEIQQRPPKLHSGHLVGEGKLDEIKKAMEEGECELVIFDCELTASQSRNISGIIKKPAIDRCNVILEIFARHARTQEAKIQVEISRLQYLLPRLTRMWSHLGKQRGGIGVRGGEGEQQIELDRRIIRHNIETLKERLEAIKVSRKEQRKRRSERVLKAALVGYTNAGKSSLMNRLCGDVVLEENKLFATLDSTFRMLTPDSKPPIVLIDTVGFISNLPNTLIEGFKSTLESALEADLLIHVVDVSDPNRKKQIEVTRQVLNDLGVKDKEILMVFNKKDLSTNPLQDKVFVRGYNDSVIISSYDQDDMKKLRAQIIEHFLNKQIPIDLFIPYQDGKAHAVLETQTNIIKRANHEEGIFYRVRAPHEMWGQLGLTQYQLKPDSSRDNPLNQL